MQAGSSTELIYRAQWGHPRTRERESAQDERERESAQDERERVLRTRERVCVCAQDERERERERERDCSMPLAVPLFSPW